MDWKSTLKENVRSFFQEEKKFLLFEEFKTHLLVVVARLA
jgi:hypothetical protein